MQTNFFCSSYEERKKEKKRKEKKKTTHHTHHPHMHDCIRCTLMLRLFDLIILFNDIIILFFLKLYEEETA